MGIPKVVVTDEEMAEALAMVKRQKELIEQLQSKEQHLTASYQQAASTIEAWQQRDQQNGEEARAQKELDMIMIQELRA